MSDRNSETEEVKKKNWKAVGGEDEEEERCEIKEA